VSCDLIMPVLCIARRFWQSSNSAALPPPRNCFPYCALNSFLTISSLLIDRTVVGTPSSYRLYFRPNNHTNLQAFPHSPRTSSMSSQPSKRDTLFNKGDLRAAEQPTSAAEHHGNVTGPERHLQEHTNEEQSCGPRNRPTKADQVNNNANLSTGHCLIAFYDQTLGRRYVGLFDQQFRKERPFS